jgi:hypothetical protein
MAVGARLVDLLDRLQSDGQVVVLAIDDLQWADRPSSRAVLFALRRLRADKVLTVVSARVGELTDPGWARFLGGDARVTRMRLAGLNPERSHRAGERARTGIAVATRGVPIGRAHRRKCSLLPGVARRDRRRRTERGAWWPAGAPGALRGDPRPGGGAVGTNPGVPGGRFGAGPARAGVDDRVGRSAARRTERGGCGGRSRTVERKCCGIGADLHPSAVPGRHLRRSQSHEPPRLHARAADSLPVTLD